MEVATKGFKSGMNIFATSPADDEGVEIVKQWCRDNGYTPKQVTIKKTDKSVFVEVQ